MTFVLGRASREKLRGVHPDLVRVVERAIKISAVDFRVGEGLRSRDRQRALVDAGASWTMNSRHLTGHAVDLLALIGGKVSWDWPLYFRIAAAVRIATLELGVAVEWGGVWDQPLARLSHDLEAEVASYVRRRRAARKKANLDGPHSQLAWGAYPR